MSKRTGPAQRTTPGISVDGAYGMWGSMALLPEVMRNSHDPPPASEIPGYVSYNRDRTIDVLEELQKGIRGVVTDAETGKRLYARIKVEGDYAAVYTNPASGAYFKYIPSPSGSYTVTAFVNGYDPMTLTVEAQSEDFAVLNFALQFNSELNYAALSVGALLTWTTPAQSEIYHSLETADSKVVPIQGNDSTKGFINLDFGPHHMITDQQGEDFTVYCGNNTEFQVSAAFDVDDLEAQEHVVGTGQGTTSFDLAGIGLDAARFVQVSSTQGTIEVDAVEAKPNPILVVGEKYKVIVSTHVKNEAGIPLDEARIAEFSVVKEASENVDKQGAKVERDASEPAGNATSLTLDSPSVTDDDLEAVRKLSHLERLDVLSGNITDAGLKHLQEMTKLKMLSLKGSRVSDAGLKYIQGLAQLEMLSLERTQVAGPGLQHLKGLPNLRYLNLRGTPVSDASLDFLSELTKLQRLRLGGSKVSETGVQKIQEALPDCTISNSTRQRR